MADTTNPGSPDRAWRLAVTLIVAATALRLAYLAWACPYALVEDEAHYWEWSRRPDWSYYSKGPGIAWTIALAARLLGTSEFAVRAPAPLFAGLFALAIAALARDTSREPRASLHAAALAILVPAFQVTALLATIDMPYLACWAVASWALWRAIDRESHWGWPLAGAAVAIGFLFKYTILLLPIGLAAYLILRPRGQRAPVRSAHALAGTAIALLGTVPVLIWNAPRAWPTIRHLLGHLDLPAGDQPPAAQHPWSPLQTLEFLGTQVGILAPAVAIMVAAVARSMRVRRADEEWPAALFLICLAAPIILFYVAVTFVAEAEANWALGGYTTLLVLAGSHAARTRSRRGSRLAWHATVVAGILVALLGARADLVARLPPLDRWIPANRLMAAPPMASDAAGQLERLRAETGLEPFVITETYGAASEMAFYLPGRPVVYCSSGLLGQGRRTQYSYWADTDLADLERLRGRPALLIGAWRERWEAAFERVQEIGPLPHEAKRGRPSFLGHGYRGFP